MKRLIKENIYNVSVIDWNLRKFHGPSFSVKNGTTYNAYVVDDRDITLIDLVEVEFFDDYIRQVNEILEGRIPTNLVINHSEQDHSGSFMKLLEIYPDINIYCSKKAGLFMNKMFGIEFAYNFVKTGDTLNTGKYNLAFYDMTMLHWPDSIATYLVEEKVLFSNDAFGQHIASTHYFDDEHGLVKCLYQAKEYYANIIMPMAKILANKLNELSSLDIEIIAPSHGVVWRSYVSEIISNYASWANFETTDKVVIVYDTMWGTTDAMAKEIALKLQDKKVCVKFYQFSKSEISEIVTELIDAKVVMVGSPTIYGNMLANLGYFFEELRVLKPKGKLGVSFGNYGWSNGATRRIETLMHEVGIEVLDTNISANFTMEEKDYDEISNVIDEVVKRMEEM